MGKTSEASKTQLLPTGHLWASEVMRLAWGHQRSCSKGHHWGACSRQQRDTEAPGGKATNRRRDNCAQIGRAGGRDSPEARSPRNPGGTHQSLPRPVPKGTGIRCAPLSPGGVRNPEGNRGRRRVRRGAKPYPLPSSRPAEPLLRAWSTEQEFGGHCLYYKRLFHLAQSIHL